MAAGMTGALSARFRRIRALALLTAALSLLVVAVSAYLRLAGAGLGCEDWPACYGSNLAGAPHPAWPGARLLHRIAASAALLAALLLAWNCWRPRPLQPEARRAMRLLALMLLLALLGAWSADPRRVAVNWANIVGGLALVALSWRVMASASSLPRGEAGRQGAVARAALAALAATVLLGGLIGARYAAPACGTLPFCGGAWLPEGGWAALNPFALLAGPAGPGDAGGVLLHLLHRLGALVALALFAVLALRRGKAARMLLALLVLEILLGALAVSGHALWPALAHNAVAALLLAAAAGLKPAAAR